MVAHQVVSCINNALSRLIGPHIWRAHKARNAVKSLHRVLKGRTVSPQICNSLPRPPFQAVLTGHHTCCWSWSTCILSGTGQVLDLVDRHGLRTAIEPTTGACHLLQDLSPTKMLDIYNAVWWLRMGMGCCRYWAWLTCRACAMPWWTCWVNPMPYSC